MKSLMLIAATSFFLSSNAKAVENWEEVYVLDNGTRITRKPSGVTLETRGGGTTSARAISLGKGIRLGALTANDDVSLTTEMDPTQFRNELLKLGTIKRATINISEETAPAARKRVFGVNRPVANVSNPTPQVTPRSAAPQNSRFGLRRAAPQNAASQNAAPQRSRFGLRRAAPRSAAPQNAAPQRSRFGLRRAAPRSAAPQNAAPQRSRFGLRRAAPQNAASQNAAPQRSRFGSKRAS